MLKSYLSAWKKPFSFRGKSTRKEYWQFLILNAIILVFFLFLGFLGVANNISLAPISTPLYLIGLLFTFGSLWISLPLTVRRIRDVGMSWKWIFFASLPYIGGVFVLIFLTRSSMVVIDGNEYYFRYPTKKLHIIGYWIGGVAWFLFGYLTPLILAFRSLK
jgi:uncharacterized membrane protein YhaH (DUF805 family)